MNRGEAGVSSVVSAVLVFALFSAATIMYTLNTVPDRIESAEATNQRQAREAFSRIQGNLESLSASGDEGPFATNIPLAARPIALLQRSAGTGVLAVEDNRFGVAATWPNGTLLPLLGDQATGRPDQAMPGTIANVTALDSLVFGLDSSGISGNNKYARVAATSTSGGVTVTVTVEHTTEADAVGCDATGIVLSIAATGFTTTTRPILCGVGSDLGSVGNPHAIDVLQEPGVEGAFGRLATPFNISLSATSAGGGATGTGTYLAVWRDSAGVVQVSGQSGQVYTTPLNLTGDILRYTPSTFQFPAQELAYEGGAVVARQSAGEAVIARPALSLSATGSRGYLAITLVTLDGSGSRGGPGTSTVTVTHESTTTLLLSAPGAVNWTFTTPEPAAWAGMFNQARLAANLTAAQVTVAATSDAARVSLQTAGGITGWTISLRLIEARASVS